MIWKSRIKRGLLLIQTFLLSFNVYSEVVLPHLIGDGMVLQRDMPVRIWGWALPGEQIQISFGESKFSAVTDPEGNWSIVLPPQSAGGPYTMLIEGNNSIRISDILFGDIWVCSGQSNMEISLKRVEPLYPGEIAQSENPDIRYFQVPKKYNFKAPQVDFESGNWHHVNPQTAPKISAVAYFFAKELYKKYHIPIGLINSSLGGSPIEAWLSEEALREFPDHYAEAMRFRDDDLIAQIEAADNARSNQWYCELWKQDAGYRNPTALWRYPDLDDSAWSLMKLPCYWADKELGPVNGVVWFRKEITIPESMTGKPALLILGRIVDADSVWVNGKYAGTTSYQYPPRRYEIPADFLKTGKNTIAIRVVSTIDRGGFVPDKPYEIVLGDQKIDLTGEWKYNLGVAMPPLDPPTFIQWKPMGLFNAMIAPLLNYSIKGILWYQGESNTNNPKEYSGLFATLINDWREKWGQDDVPFLYVQLPNFMEAVENPGDSDWAEFRQVQLNALGIKNTGMAVTIDLGEWNDIHPLNKEGVGKRLALIAQKVAYEEENIIFSGPLYQSMEPFGSKLILSFSNTGSGLIVKEGEELKHFAIAGDDGKFVWADAKIEGNNVIVWSDKVEKPIVVRYAWADNPVGANLYNREGLPASPFTTQK